MIAPHLWIARRNGASFSKAKCVRDSRCNKTNMKPAFAADAARRRSEHDPGTHAEAFRSGVQRLNKSRAGARLFTRGLQLSRKLGCGAYTKCPDTHPKRARLGSNSMAAPCRRERAQRKRALVDSSEGRSLPPLQTMYQLPSHQQCRRLPHHSLQPQSGV
jgi:hypothetical protein